MYVRWFTLCLIANILLCFVYAFRCLVKWDSHRPILKSAFSVRCTLTNCTSFPNLRRQHVTPIDIRAAVVILRAHCESLYPLIPTLHKLLSTVPFAVDHALYTIVNHTTSRITAKESHHLTCFMLTARCHYSAVKLEQNVICGNKTYMQKV